MAKTSLFCFFILFLCFYFGCEPQKQNTVPAQVESQAEPAKTSFPAFLVGTWKPRDPDQCRWEFTFEKDGTISSMRNFMGTYFKVSEGGAVEHNSDANAEAACTLGPIEVNYVPNSRILAVKVVTDYFMLHIYDVMMEGNNVDRIFGPVSGDGKIWTAEWRSFSRLIDDPPMDFNNPSITPAIIFYKVREANQPSKGNR